MNEDIKQDAPENEAGAEDLAGQETAAAAETAEVQQPSSEEIIAGLEAEKMELQDKLLRSIAEVDNVRKRSARETADARVYAIERFAQDLLSVADNLSRALGALSDEDRAALGDAGKSLLGGIEMTQKELHTALARHGVTSIDAAPGAAFDPNLHQAVSQVPSDQPSGAIAQTFQNGWKISDRVLRAAMVAVSTGPAN